MSVIIEIRSVNIRYGENEVMSDIQVFFDGHDQKRKTLISGHQNLTAEEYEENNTLDKLKALIEESLNKDEATE